MAEAVTPEAVTLPEKFDPRSESLKKTINPKADRLNFIDVRRGKPIICCGAVRKGKTCRQLAGMGTVHNGSGRCKYHGGNNTGPRTEQGKKAVSQNAQKHGLYGTVLSDDERAVYHELLGNKTVTLEHEIFMQKAKIVVYLRKWKKKLEERGEAATKTWRRSTDSATEWYYAGTIEDPILQRALDQLRRLVDSHAKLTNGDSESILTQINRELRAASQMDVSNSWGGAAVRREGSEDGPGAE